MNWDLIVFVVFPYIAITMAITVGIIRYRYRPFTHSSYSTQFLEGKAQFWGSVPWHYGVLLILLGHLLALLFPRVILAWTSSPGRLMVFEIVGIALGVLALGGLTILFFRRIFDAKVKSVTSWLNYTVLLLLMAQVLSGTLIAIFHRWGLSWGAYGLSPYLWSLFRLQPDPGFLTQLPLLVKFHAFNAFLLILLIPFTPLVHFMSLPVLYPLRPPQVVIWNTRRRFEK